MQIPNYSRYAATKEGNIISLDYKRTGKQKVLKPALDARGYLRTMLLNDNGKYDTVKVHRIIALAYLGKSSLEVNHKNGIKSDNSIDNLEYVTRSENAKHSYKQLKRKSYFKEGSRNINAKLTPEAIKEIRETAANCGRYYGREKLANKFGVTEAHIKDIVNDKSLWKSVYTTLNHGSM